LLVGDTKFAVRSHALFHRQGQRPDRRQISGSVREGEYRELLLQLAEQSSAAGIKRALIVRQTASALDPVAALRLITDLRAFGFSPGYRFALLHEAGTQRSIEFAVLAALNRGWQVKAFTDRDIALDWLDER
jgi:hypothetical protein